MESKAKSLLASPGGLPPNADAVVAGNTGPGSTRSVRSRKRTRQWWRRGLLALLILGTCLYVFRAPILQSLAAFLVVDQQGPADYVLILASADRRYDHAADLYQSGSASHILLFESRPERLERMGLKPLFVALTQHELAGRGVPPEAISVIPGQTRTDWDRARRLRDWLQQQPAVSIVVLCDRFGGRRLRYIYDEILGADYASRVRVSALPDRQFGERDWWQNRQATVYLFDCYLRLAYDRLSGEDSEEWREWDPQEYSKKLR